MSLFIAVGVFLFAAMAAVLALFPPLLTLIELSWRYLQQLWQGPITTQPFSQLSSPQKPSVRKRARAKK